MTCKSIGNKRYALDCCSIISPWEASDNAEAKSLADIVFVFTEERNIKSKKKQKDFSIILLYLKQKNIRKFLFKNIDILQF